MNIGVIGRVADGKNIVDGQTIKTKILVEELKNRYPKAVYSIVDSYKSQNNILLYIIRVIRCIKNSDVIFVLLSSKGIKVTFPIITLLNKKYKKPIIHDVIGGRLDEIAINNKIIYKCIKSFYINMVESKGLADKLKMIGINNVEVVPNFKRVKSISKSDIKRNNLPPYKFCTFSRISKAKGIEEAINAVRLINKQEKSNKVILDIYGPIEDEYKDEFYEILSDLDKVISYKGCVDYKESVDTLKDYTALLFPTTFYGEGFPGTIIDAFSAGLPVIATDWHCNPEIIEEYKTGLLYSASNPSELSEKILEYISSPEKIYIMKTNCIIESKKYQADEVMNQIINIMNKVL